ncbi:LysR family transcriptional regulator ArgP [Pseudorhodoferax sp.]|uniref:LysR family transcriptional regulator ArgP n=1 Tax=Pseudorhodoferax sp. TaxID=1993553 RepID=UPI002DD6B674|nr:LysR family transcriptional regulator ArgP [Pseudorhodoferax sp.]
MHHLDPGQLDALAAVLREGSFERAAHSLHVTPSAVSQRIKALEDRVGAVLVVRAQPCVATPMGQRLRHHAERLALLAHELQPLLASTSGSAGGRGAGAAPPTLRIAVNADSLATWFMPAAAAFATASGALLDLVLDDQDHTADALRRGEVLAAVTAEATPVPGARSVALGRLRYRATASPAFMARHFAPGVNVRTLAVAPCLRFNQKDQLQARWLRRVCRRTLHPPCHGLASSQGFVDACIAGLGWALNPEALVRPALADGRLVELLPGKVLDLALWWQASRLAVPLLQQLGEHVQQQALRHLHQGAG